jgi:hypothetical protein
METVDWGEEPEAMAGGAEGKESRENARAATSRPAAPVLSFKSAESRLAARIKTVRMFDNIRGIKRVEVLIFSPIK